MSLRSFHLIFVFCSGFLSLGMAFWGLRLYRAEGNTQGLVWGVVGVLLALGLFFYERWFSGKNGPLADHE